MNDEDEIGFLVSLLCSMNHMHFYSPNRESEKNIIVTASLSPFLSELLGWWWYGSGMCLVVNFIYYSLFTSFYFMHYFLKFLHFFLRRIYVCPSPLPQFLLSTLPSPEGFCYYFCVLLSILFPISITHSPDQSKEYKKRTKTLSYISTIATTKRISVKSPRTHFSYCTHYSQSIQFYGKRKTYKNMLTATTTTPIQN